MATKPKSILVLNSGSASLSLALYEARPGVPLLLEGTIQRVGIEGGRVSIRREEAPQPVLEEDRDVSSFADAFRLALDLLEQEGYREQVQVVSHRVVHGGTDRFDPQAVTENLLDDLRALVPLAPKHLPQAVTGIEIAQERLSEAEHLACFDTAFHRDLPQVAQMLPLPRRFWEAGLRRVGFHGLSYQSIVQKLEQEHEEESAEERQVIAHLGGGASMVALEGGRPVETTMGLTPAGGLVMSTRSGDLDPGVLTYLAQENGLGEEQLRDLVHEESGLLGISQTSGGVRDLVEEERDPRAAEAVDLFCYHAKKHLGALCAALGGLDTLVFTGSVGTEAAEVRARICEGLDFLGLQLSDERNGAGGPALSPQGSPVTVLALESDEERILAQHARDYWAASTS